MNQNDPLLISELRRDEGVRYSPYPDTKGIPTVGVGHNLRASPLPDGWLYPLTDAQIDQLLESDIRIAIHNLDGFVGWWRNLSYARQRVIVNMCFQLGIDKLLKFHNTLAHIENAAYPDAAKDMLNSTWASECPDRARRLSKMMING